MSENTERNRGSEGSWRKQGWAIATMFILVPLLVMQVTDEVNWTFSDFVFAGVLMAAVGASFDLAVRMTRNRAYCAAVAVALAAAFVLVWVNGAVGIIGSEDNPANLMFGGVLAIGFIGSALARFEPRGMARAMVATALAQVLFAVIALFAGLASPASGPLEILSLNGGFAVLWLASGGFSGERRAGRCIEALRRR